MIDTNEFGAMLKSMGFVDFSGVPCSYLAPLINYAINENAFIMANNEGDAVAIASGISLCAMQDCKDSANYGVVLMQNSGLSNALSPLTSLNDTFKIPILGFVSLRGERDIHNKNTDEPQHELLGIITDKLLETCKIEYMFLSDDMNQAKNQLQMAKNTIMQGRSFFFIVKNNTLSKVALQRNPLENYTQDKNTQKVCENISSSHLPTRLESLEILQKLAKANNAALLATTGKSGRELYEIQDSKNQLYMVGSMGCVSSLGVGIALKTHKKVIAIDGDSALLMRLGALAHNAYYTKCANKGNFCHIVLDNQCHDSTGGQFNLSPFVDFASVARHCGYEYVYITYDLQSFEAAMRAFLDSKGGGAWFIYLRIAKGSKKDLGRPAITPQDVARRFGAFLREK